METRRKEREMSKDLIDKFQPYYMFVNVDGDRANVEWDKRWTFGAPIKPCNADASGHATH